MAIHTGILTGNSLISFDPSRVVTVANENRPAAVSALVCISY
jgi:hypothetical protein